jgi:nitrate/nitrite transporter NarK
MTFSKGCRSTLNGICAACGKVGALIGTMVFAIAAERFGDAIVLCACGVLSICGLVLTLLCVSSNDNVSDDLVKTMTASHAEAHDDEAETQLPLRVVLSGPSLFDLYDDEV